MSRYLVTGGTGFLGEHLVRRLIEDGHDVRVMARSAFRTLNELGAELIRADIADGDDLGRALVGVEGVFHLAGMVSRDADDGQRMMRVHVDGTRRVIELAAKARVRRVVVASSSGTVAVSEHEHIHDENSGYASEVVGGWPYYTSKIFQEKVAFELGEQLGIEVVVVNPSLLLGPGDRRLSSTRDVLRFMRRELPIVPEGGINFVDVRDAAAATAEAMSRGRVGERYLLGGPNWTFKEFFGRLGRIAKVSPPKWRLPSRLSEFGAGLLESAYRARGKQSPVDRMSVEMSRHFWYVDSSKAARELSFEARDPSLTLADTVRYLRQNIETDA